MMVEHDCTIAHQGREYTAGGAFVGDDRAAVYVLDRPVRGLYPVTSWHGHLMGFARVTSEWSRCYRNWPFPARWRSYSVRLLDGTRWHGRHAWDGGDLLFLKRKAGDR